MQRHRGDVRCFCCQFAQQGFDGTGVAGALDVEQAGELFLSFQVFNQRNNLLARAANGRHAGACIDSWFDTFKLLVVGDEGIEVVDAELHHCHGTQLILGKGLLALPHQAAAVASHTHRVLSAQTTGRVSGSNLTHGHAHHSSRAGTQVRQQIRQSDLDGCDGNLRSLRVVRLLVIGDDLAHRPTGFEIHNLIKLAHALGEHRGACHQVLRHLAMLRTEPRVHKHWTSLVGRIRNLNTWGFLALSHNAQTLDCVLSIRSQHGRTGTTMVTSSSRTRNGTQTRDVINRGVINKLRKISCSSTATRRQQTRHNQRGRIISTQQQSGSLIGVRQLGIIRSHKLADHGMRVGSAKTETTHTRNRATRIARPLTRILNNLQMLSIKINVGVRPREVQRRGDRPIAHTLHNLDQTSSTRSGLGVPKVRLGTAQQQRLIRVAPATQHRTQRSSLNRITQNSAGAVGLHIVNLARLNASVRVSALQHSHLRIRIRRGQTIGSAIGIHSRTLDNGINRVAIRNGVLHALEHHQTGAIGTDKTIRILGKRFDRTTRANHAELTESSGNKRRSHNIDAPGKHDVRFARTQRTNRLVHRHQRRRTRSVNADRRAAEIKSIRNTVGDHRTGITRQRIRMRLRWIRSDHHPIVIVGGTDNHANIAAPQLISGNMCVFQRLPRKLHHDALLRIRIGRLQRRQTEKLRIEAGNIIQITASGVDLLHLRSHHLIAGVLRPTAKRQLTSSGPTLYQQLPHCLSICRPRETRRQTNNRDVMIAGVRGTTGVRTDTIRSSRRPHPALGRTINQTLG